MKSLFSFVAHLMLMCVSAGAATLTGSFSSIARGSVVNLTAQGVLDWVHWGLYSDTSLDRKASVTPRISDFSLVTVSNFFGFAYQFSDNWNGYSWSDGTPNAVVTDTRTGVYAVGMRHGFQFSVPAGTSVQTLKVYVGTYGAAGKLQAFLSDNSAPDYVSTALTNAANGPSGVYTLTFAGRTIGSRLTVKWTVASMLDPLYANVTLQSAALTATDANNPPYVGLTSPVDSASFNAGGNITLAASAMDFDGTITKVEFFQGTTKLGEDSSSPFSFSWNNVPAGFYVLTARATDNAGASSISESVEVFVTGSGGSLSGSVTRPPTLATQVDLTAEGTGDWIHWGARIDGLIDRKADVGAQISDCALIGENMVERFGDNYTGFSWSDGSPTDRATNTTTGIYISGVTNGFELTVPADLTNRTLKVYVGLYAAQGRLQAWLSDFSAKAYANFSLSNFYGNAYGVYALGYAAASPGQFLTVRYTAPVVFDQDYGNVTLQAATLNGRPIVTAPTQVTLQNPRWVGGDFVFSFPSVAGASYSAKFAPALPTTSWQTLGNFTGSGALIYVTNRSPSASARFYRVESR
jgi:hypothetical protein